ncbi:MAG: hypothetical protein P8K77_03255 [Polaribacter sp.]|nr:hypothetical protein [Polaribacter sp.]
MKRKKPLLFAISLFIVSSVCSQKKIYIDENMKIIDSLLFSEKCKASVLKCLSYNTDTLEINKILYSYSFKKISKKQFHQLRKFWSIETKKKIDSNTTLIIQYRDTLYNYDINYARHIKHTKNHTEAKHLKFTLKKHLSNIKRWEKRQEKCIKKLSKKSKANAIYTYKHAFENTLSEYKTIKWVKDRGMSKNYFFKINYNYQVVIVKPNGNYFLSGGHLDKTMLKRLLKKNDWASFRNDLKKSYQSLHKTGYGLFKQVKGYHKDHCF